MEKFRVYGIMNSIEYGLSYISYDNNSSRFELMPQDGISTIYNNVEDANFAIKEHKRTRQDQKVDEYKIVTVLN